MGNKLASPFPSYEVAMTHLDPMEMGHLKNKFKQLTRNKDTVNQQIFCQNCHVSASCDQYIRKHILPRLFTVMDSRRDGALDYEEFLCAIALFRIGGYDEKFRVLFLMYDPVKGGILQRENLRRMLVDAMIAVQIEKMPTQTLEAWIEQQSELAECMVDMVLLQYAAQDGKLDFQEFIAFVKMEGSVQGLLKTLPEAIDF